MPNYKRKYTLNEHFLDCIDSEEKAYYLGFMYADGYNGEEAQRWKIAIDLQKQDEPILRTFCVLLGTNRPLCFDKRGCCSLSFTSKRLSVRLAELGCHRAKTFTITFPDWMPVDLIPHFVRGYIDGDGWIHFDGEKGVTVAALGADSFARRMAKIIESACGVHTTLSAHPKSAGITQWQVRGRDQVSTVLAWLYKDATVYLERKKRKAEQVLTPVYYLSKPNGSDVHLAVLTELQIPLIVARIEEGERFGQIALDYGVDKSAIRDISNGRTWHHLTGFTKEANLKRGQAKGVTHPMSKLTEGQVRQIKSLLREGLSNPEIAQQFPVSKDMVSKIRCGKCWTHI